MLVIFLIAVAAVSIGSLAAAVGCSRLQQAAACSDGVDAEEPRAHTGSDGGDGGEAGPRWRRSRGGGGACGGGAGGKGDGAVWCAVALPPKARVSQFTFKVQLPTALLRGMVSMENA